MNYWLFKSEPEAWSWDEQKKEGAKGAEWDGVRNYQARNIMRKMRQGDLAFFYHSGEERRVVGVVKVVVEAHPDSTDGTGVWDCVDVAAVADAPRPVTLAEIKANQGLKDMVLVKNSRLSVQPVTAKEWAIISRLAGLEKQARGQAGGKYGAGSDQLSRCRGCRDCRLPHWLGVVCRFRQRLAARLR